MKILFVIFFILSFTSCMHWGMMGIGHNHHTGQMHMMTTTSVQEKEVTDGDVKAIGFFPSLEYGKDVILTLKLMDAMNSSPISDAQVYFEAQYIDPVTHENHHDSLYYTKLLVVESRVQGIYSIPYRTIQEGEHKLRFYITAIGQRMLEPEIVVETTRALSGENQEHHGSMMSETSAPTSMIIGAASIGIMMTTMFMMGH